MKSKIERTNKASGKQKEKYFVYTVLMGLPKITYMSPGLYNGLLISKRQNMTQNVYYITICCSSPKPDYKLKYNNS